MMYRNYEEDMEKAGRKSCLFRSSNLILMKDAFFELEI